MNPKVDNHVHLVKGDLMIAAGSDSELRFLGKCGMETFPKTGLKRVGIF